MGMCGPMRRWLIVQNVKSQRRVAGGVFGGPAEVGRSFRGAVEVRRSFRGPAEVGRSFRGAVEVRRSFRGPAEVGRSFRVAG
jgi:hypothetical protein